MERVMGIEPTYQAWEARVLPLNYTRNFFVIVLVVAMPVLFVNA